MPANESTMTAASTGQLVAIAKRCQILDEEKNFAGKARGLGNRRDIGKCADSTPQRRVERATLSTLGSAISNALRDEFGTQTSHSFGNFGRFCHKSVIQGLNGAAERD